jgi:integrase
VAPIQIGATFRVGARGYPPDMSDASVRVRTTPRGEFRWQLRYRVDGRPGSRTFTTEEAATRWLAVFRAAGPEEGLALLDAAEAGEPPLCDLTVGEVVARYVETASGITEGTRGSYRQEAARDILPTLGALPLVALTRDSVRKWINNLASPLTDLEIAAHRSLCPRCAPAADGRPARDCRALKQRRDGLSGKTIANRHGLLSAACTWAVENGYLAVNSCRGVRLPTTLRRDPVFLSAAEVAEITETVDKRYRDLVVVLAGTGLRWSEATALRVSDVDFTRTKAVLVHVRRAWKDTDQGPMVLGPPKSPRSRRTIPLRHPNPVVDALRRAVVGRPGGAWVFTSPRGMVLRNGSFHGRVWSPAMTTLQARGWTARPSIHDLRHTAASLMIAAGQDISAVSRILGHEKVSTTVDIYGHLRPGAQDEALSALGAALASALEGGAEGQLHDLPAAG